MPSISKNRDISLFFLPSPLGYALPMKRERWQTKSDGEGASAAEAKCHLRALRTNDERGLASKNITSVVCSLRLQPLSTASPPLSPRSVPLLSLCDIFPVSSGKSAPKGKAR